MEATHQLILVMASHKNKNKWLNDLWRRNQLASFIPVCIWLLFFHFLRNCPQLLSTPAIPLHTVWSLCARWSRFDPPTTRGRQNRSHEATVDGHSEAYLVLICHLYEQVCLQYYMCTRIVSASVSREIKQLGEYEISPYFWRRVNTICSLLSNLSWLNWIVRSKSLVRTD